VTNMSSMFRGASTFNQPLEQWVVGNNRTEMSDMVCDAISLNQTLEKWNVIDDEKFEDYIGRSKDA
jgi:hypothetical protein